MSERSPSAFMLSITLHGAAVAIVLFFTYAVSQKSKESPAVFELVAGPGNNYMATEAPALGSPVGIKVEIPSTPTLTVEIAPEPVAEPTPVVATPKPTPIAPAPVEKAPPTPQPQSKPVETTIPNFKKQIANKVLRAELNTKKKIEKERVEEAKRITKEEFERANKTKAVAVAKGAPAVKVSKIDAEGIAAGVVGGSAKNKSGGAGGKALVAEDGAKMERYFALLKSRLKESHEKPAGLSDTLMADVEFYVGADGAISGAKITSSSGSAEFDRSVLEAFSRTKSIGARPDKKGDLVKLKFKMREEDGD